MKRNHLAVAEVAAVVPHYEEGVGLVSRIFRMDGGEIFDPRPPLTLMKYLLRPYGFKYSDYRKMQTEGFVGRQSVPIMWAGQTFLTCKVLHARVAGDVTYGYVRLEAVSGVSASGDAGVLRLLDGREIQTAQKLRGLRHATADAALLVMFSLTKQRKDGQELDTALARMVREAKADRHGRLVTQMENVGGSNRVVREFEESVFKSVAAASELPQEPELPEPVKALTEQQKLETVLEQLDPSVAATLRAWILKA